MNKITVKPNDIFSTWIVWNNLKGEVFLVEQCLTKSRITADGEKFSDWIHVTEMARFLMNNKIDYVCYL